MRREYMPSFAVFPCHFVLAIALMHGSFCIKHDIFRTWWCLSPYPQHNYFAFLALKLKTNIMYSSSSWGKT